MKLLTIAPRVSLDGERNCSRSNILYHSSLKFFFSTRTDRTAFPAPHRAPTHNMANLSLSAKVCVGIVTVVGICLASLLCFRLVKKDGNGGEDSEQGIKREGAEPARDPKLLQGLKLPEDPKLPETPEQRQDSQQSEDLQQPQDRKPSQDPERPQEPVVPETESTGGSDCRPTTQPRRKSYKRAGMPKVQLVGRHQGYVLHEANKDTQAPQTAQIEDYAPGDT
ncbi:hypothetical protein GGR50DRAFT_589770 [Xylaria sp. CBS 124048]|nr:hypothetical protein GGR50DRAFT_589770 [Xylaria sp. CBS 124048]